MSTDMMQSIAQRCAERLQAILTIRPDGFWIVEIGNMLHRTDMRAMVSAQEGAISITLRMPPGTRSSSEWWILTISQIDGRFIEYDALEEQIPWGQPGRRQMVRIKDRKEGQRFYDFALKELLKVLDRDPAEQQGGNNYWHSSRVFT